MELVASVGITRINWIVQCYPDHLERTALEAARKCGMEFNLVLKLFEFGKTDWSSRQANKWEPALWGYDHPEVYARRAPLDDSWADPATPVKIIRIVKDDDAPFDETRLGIWVSEDGQNYSAYSGPCKSTNTVRQYKPLRLWERTYEQERPVRVIELSNLDIREKHFAVSCRPNGKTGTFQNQLHRLVEIVADDGRPVYTQYGLMLDAGDAGIQEQGTKSGSIMRTLRTDQAMDIGNTDSGEHRMAFLWDKSPLGHSGCLSGKDRLEFRHALDNQRNVIGFRRHYDAITDRMFSPAVPRKDRTASDITLRSLSSWRNSPTTTPPRARIWPGLPSVAISGTRQVS